MVTFNMLAYRIDRTLFAILDIHVELVYNLVNFISLIWCAFFKKYSNSWQEAPEDVLEMILRRLNLSGRVRFSSLCKFWGCVSMRRDDIPAPPQLPWLVHPQVPGMPPNLTFSNLSEGKVFKLSFTKTTYATIFCGSSKGWLFMSQKYAWLKLERSFLLNPISGARHQLPYLMNDSFVETVAVSSAYVSECIVAIVVNDEKELGLCRPGDKSWSVFQVLQETNYVCQIANLMFSSSGALHALVLCSGNGVSGVGAVQTLKLGDVLVKLMLVYYEPEWWMDDDVFPGMAYNVYLLESTNNQVLLVHHVYESVGHEDENEAAAFQYNRTQRFRIHMIDEDNGNFVGVRTLEDQILFVSNQGSSFALPASDFKELQGNCIYFATTGGSGPDSGRIKRPFPNISREIGIFYLDSGRIKRPFPSMMISRYGWGPSWFTPSFLHHVLKDK